jgi:hypothetical protein
MLILMGTSLTSARAIAKWCLMCGAAACKETMIEALEAKKRAAMAAGEAATVAVEEIDQTLSTLRKEG